MASYFQMGHDTENLVGETDLEAFSGIVLSPVNRGPDELRTRMVQFREQGEFDIILDPQLYVPRSMMIHLQDQPYFPADFDSGDFFSGSWWNGPIEFLCEFASELEVDAVASPVILPKIYNEEYYAQSASVSLQLSSNIDSKIRTLSSILVEGKQLTDHEWVMRISSIISEIDSDGYYLVVDSNIDPRREFSDDSELFGIMYLIKLLEDTGRPVLVSFCSSDMILFKAAGATNCATGKFFNLRRFTASRFEEPPGGGGGQLAYWFEHSLLAFLREADILRLQDEGFADLLCTLHSDNHWSSVILDLIDNSPGQAWVGNGWRQYLSWFGKTERELNDEPLDKAKAWLRTAERNWLALDDADILMDEPRNNGGWIRPWRQALSKFSKLETSG